MRRVIGSTLLAGAMFLGATAAPAQNGAAAPAASGVAATAVAAPMPEPGDTNAQRARSQPGNNAPFWRGVHDSGNVPGTVNNLAAGERGVLIQPITSYPGTRRVSAGEAWREIRNWWIVPYGGALLVIVVLALGLFYVARGPIGAHDEPAATGRVIERFTYFERATHWANAIAFSILAISGLLMAFGKFLLLPLIGATLFGLLTYLLKTLHNLVGPLFVVSLIILFFTFLRSNMPSRDDWQWLRRGGGLFGGGEPPSHRFNAGEKIIFWVGVLLLGIVVTVSGLWLDEIFPGADYSRGAMQVAQVVHSTATILMMAMFFGHIYLGTIGMKGAYRAMKTGYVDESWARAHHAYWYEDIRAGRIPVERSARPAPPRAGQPAS